MYQINNINIYTELNIEININIDEITISWPLSFILFGNTQKNSQNLISCIKTRTNLAEWKIILYLN